MKKALVIMLLIIGALLLMGETESAWALIVIKLAGVVAICGGLQLAGTWHLWDSFIDED